MDQNTQGVDELLFRQADMLFAIPATLKYPLSSIVKKHASLLKQISIEFSLKWFPFVYCETYLQVDS